jgi:ribosome maturation factor RimP
MQRTSVAILAGAMLTATFALAIAQQAPPMRIRGTIEKVDGHTLTVKARGGETMTVKLADKVRIGAMQKATIADIKKGAFIGVTAMPQADGSQKAIGIHIFMAAQRGVVAERHGPWDKTPGSTMTNANVETTVSGVDGQTLMVKYKGGEKKVVVPSNTPIVAMAPGNMDDLKAGAQFIIMAGKKQPDGTIAAPAINVGRNGAAPPM